ncbi:MAG: DUF1989 domain-containing protein, partial [Rhodobacteraceae bacterium]|nr:DUF1989 domain-containing protein [Paracoccaceae bacterium]
MNLAPRHDVPFERRGITTPGMPILPHGTERYLIDGNGSLTVQVAQGDEILLLDLEGCQPVEVVPFAMDGRSDAGLLGTTSKHCPVATIQTLGGGGQSGRSIQEALNRAGLDLAGADAVRVFGEGSRPGAIKRFTANENGLLVVSAPGGAMQPHKHNAATEIALYIRRARPGEKADRLAPPPPLAKAIVDANVEPGQAYIYEVRKGQYIQILDVQGRECSDFQAFSLRDLDSGLEREIDPTATRSLMGSAYPVPGIYSKYFNVDFEPLVQIVQDTCGRHDAFGLACTAKYYEDMGYPGHLNCSDNISSGLKPYGVRTRAGWPAINFFFNTAIDDTNAMGFDDPWSRPGDYVLLRALTDLVCVSSACPCDIDPANGWDPTDIQVRTYEADQDFAPGSAYRKSVGAKVHTTKKTGFHQQFAKHTGDFVEYGGYWLPNTITGLGSLGEYWGCRENVAIMDLSPLRKYEITGPDAEELMQLCMTRDIRRLSDRQVVYTAMCYEHGGMIDDGTVYRLRDNFRWVGGSDDSGLWLQKQQSERNLDAWVRNSTDQLHNVAVQGPKSRDLLSQVFWTGPTEASIEDLGWFRFSVARLGGARGVACVVSRTGYTGELGYEVFCHPRDCDEVFSRIWEAGQEYGIVPLGLAAMDMLRIEAGLAFAGQEFNDQTDPYEAGIGFTVALRTKNDDFIGR